MEKRAVTQRLLYWGIGLFAVLLAVTVFSIRDVWLARTNDARARAHFDMVQGTLPNRPTDTPGASAWLYRELERHMARQNIGDLASWRDYRSLPDAFLNYGSLLTEPAPQSESPSQILALPNTPDPTTDPTTNLQFRDQFYTSWQDHQFVVTRRKALGGPSLEEDTAANQFLKQAMPALGAVAQQLKP